MITENAQMLSTALAGQAGMMKPTHANHPCNVWTRTSKQNAAWLVAYTEALFDEYKRRRNKTEHKSMRVITAIKEQNLLDLLPDTGLTPFVNCARAQLLGVDFSMVSDVHEAYNLYMLRRWAMDKREPTWM